MQLWFLASVNLDPRVLVQKNKPIMTFCLIRKTSCWLAPPECCPIYVAYEPVFFPDFQILGTQRQKLWRIELDGGVAMERT